MNKAYVKVLGCLLIFNLLVLEGGKIDTTRFHPVHGLLSGPTLRTTIKQNIGLFKCGYLEVPGVRFVLPKEGERC